MVIPQPEVEEETEDEHNLRLETFQQEKSAILKVASTSQLSGKDRNEAIMSCITSQFQDEHFSCSPKRYEKLPTAPRGGLFSFLFFAFLFLFFSF